MYILSLVLCFFEFVSWSTVNVSRFNRAVQSTFAPRPPLPADYFTEFFFCKLSNFVENHRLSSIAVSTGTSWPVPTT